jgi:hypothetical protein
MKSNVRRRANNMVSMFRSAVARLGSVELISIVQVPPACQQTNCKHVLGGRVGRRPAKPKLTMRLRLSTQSIVKRLSGL